jgi:hypothetical protein
LNAETAKPAEKNSCTPGRVHDEGRLDRNVSGTLRAIASGHTTARATHARDRSLGLGLLPVLQRLRTWLNSFEVRVDAACRARRVRLLCGDFLPAGLFFRPSFLALPLALPLLL